MFTSLRSLRLILVNFIIITLVYAPALSSSQFGRSSQFTVGTVLSIAGNSSLMTFHSSLLPPHAEHRLLIKFRAEASLPDRQEIIESYGEPELQTRRAGESVITLQLKENVSTALAELKRMDRVIEWVEPDYVTGVRGEVSGVRDNNQGSPQANSSLITHHSSLLLIRV